MVVDLDTPVLADSGLSDTGEVPADSGPGGPVGDTGEDGDPDTWFLDGDDDGFGSTAHSVTASEAPARYVGNSVDCDDEDPESFPGATELCDGMDNDCDGDIDEEVEDLVVWFLDFDGDGYGDPDLSQLACAPEEGRWVTNSEDCDDTDPAISPDEDEVCDGEDNDCDGQVDDHDSDVRDQPTWFYDRDGDGYAGSSSVQACNAPGSRYHALAQDCDDEDPAIHPAAAEVCDGGIDNDCNGVADDNDSRVTDQQRWYTDRDGDSYGSTAYLSRCEQPSGYVENNDDCYDSNSKAHPDQTSYQSADRGDGGFDYDCSGSEKKRWTDKTSGSCEYDWSNLAWELKSEGWTDNQVADCGETEDYAIDCTLIGYIDTERRTQECR